MIDIHSHILPGVDDGARSLEEAVAMIEMAAADGTTHLVATPHRNDRYAFSHERNQALLADLRGRVGNRVTLLSGCDFHLGYENLKALEADKTCFTLNQGRYLLAEFSAFGLAPATLEVFHKLRLSGLVPIVTHPERNPLLAESEQPLLRRLVEMGCAVQVTAHSLTGGFGPEAQKVAERLLADRLVHIVASDAHDTQQRPPRLAQARAWVAAKFGDDVAQALFVDNPLAAIESCPLPYFPDLVEAKPKRRFWFF